jgi:hypothetical protein
VRWRSPRRERGRGAARRCATADDHDHNPGISGELQRRDRERRALCAVLAAIGRAHPAGLPGRPVRVPQRTSLPPGRAVCPGWAVTRALVGALVALTVAGCLCAGYVLGRGSAPDRGDAARERQSSYRNSYAIAERSARAEARARGRRRGEQRGRRAGSANGRREGAARGRARADRLASAAAASTAPSAPAPASCPLGEVPALPAAGLAPGSCINECSPLASNRSGCIGAQPLPPCEPGKFLTPDGYACRPTDAGSP